MNKANTAAQAEQLSRRRSKMLPLLAVLFLLQQAAYISGAAAGSGERTVDYVQNGAWLVLSVVLLLFLATGGGWIYSRQVRELANDEGTRANQSDALRIGFLVAMAMAILLFVVTLFEPVGGRDAIHVIMTFGIASALLRFGMLERRAHRDG